jgi:hypothetical protein
MTHREIMEHTTSQSGKDSKVYLSNKLSIVSEILSPQKAQGIQSIPPIEQHLRQDTFSLAGAL